MKLDRFQLHKWITSLAALVIIILFLGGCVLTNHPPIITSLKVEREIVPTSRSCQIECVALDEDGDSLNFLWSASGGNISGEGSVVTWIAPDTSGTYTIAVTVTDDNGGEATDSISITVRVNHPPIIEDLIVTSEYPKYVKEYSGGYKILNGKSCEIKCVASDPEGDKLSYEWSASGITISEEDPSITWTAPVQRGEVTVTVTVSDGSGGIATKSIVFKVETCTCAFR